MKKLLFTTLAILVMSGAMAQSPAFPDIPAGHWAGDAVERIANLGIIIGFPDGTFRGNENITRYQAALVISRTLDVIQRDMDAVRALHETDIVSMRNALQELASDIAANSVRLTGVENSVVSIIARLDDMEAMMMNMPDSGVSVEQVNALIGSLRTELVALINANANRIGVLDSAVASLSADVSSVSDDVVSNADRIANLEAGLAVLEETLLGMPDVDMGPMMGEMSALQDEVANLRNRIAAVEIQADSASAAAAAAAATADGAAAAVEALRAQIRQNGRSIDAIEALIALLNDDVLGIQDDLDGIRADMMNMAPPEMMADPQVARNASDIANIRDFVILLRRNQVDLQNRLSDLEASGLASADAIADLSARLDAVEGELLRLEGEVSLDYNVVRMFPGNAAFDVDRVLGEDLPRGSGLSVFHDDNDTDDDFSSTPDFTGNEDGDVEIGLEATFTFADTKNALGSPNALNGFSGVIDLSLERDYSAIDDDGDRFRGYVISLDDLTTTYDPIGAEPITFQFGEEIDVDFTPYVVLGGYDGFVANVGTPEFLAAFDPTLTFFYGSPGTDAYAYGVRGTLSPLDGISGGVSFATGANNAGEYGDIGDGTIADPDGDNDTQTVLSVDGEASISIIDLAFEFSTETLAGSDVTTESIIVTPTSDESNTVLYVTADIDGEALPILNSLSANFRAMDDVWNGLEYFQDVDGVVDEDDVDDAEDDYPFDLDQTGFRVDAGLGLFILDVDVFFDSYQTNVSDDDDNNDDSTTAFGADASAALFAGFSLTAFFEQVSASIDSGDTNVVDTNDGTTTLEDGSSVTVNTERNDQYDTGFGIGLEHDGAADNALISGLNIDFEFSLTEADFSVTTITADLDYDLSISILNLTPYVGFESVTDADDEAGEDDYTTITAGAGFETDPLDIIFEPSLNGNVNFRQGSHAIQGGNEYDSNVLQFNVGFTLGAFLLDNSTLSFDYGSFTGTNVDAVVSDDADTGGITTSTSGFEVVWDYYDLEFVYGDYTNDPDTDTDGDESKGQAFGISYTVTF